MCRTGEGSLMTLRSIRQLFCVPAFERFNTADSCL
jgi:hypothetical protein